MISRLLRTSTFRLALVYMALFGGSVLLLLGFIYVATAGYAGRQTDAAIRAEILSLAEQYNQRGLDGLAATIRGRAARNPRGHAIYLLADAEGRRIVGNLDRWPVGREQPDRWVEFEIQDPDSPRGDAYLARARHIALRGGFHLLVGQDIQEQQRLKRLIVEALAWGLALMLALGLAGGALMSRATLRRVESVNRASREIMKGDLARRIPTTGSGDEYDQLAENLNSMLAQIEALMSGIRQVSDNIAHDLRSPLSRLRSQLELARMRAGGAGTQAMIDALIADVDSLLATFNALLRIAEIEAGGRRAGFAAVDLAALVRDAVELYEPLAQERRQTISTRIDPGLAVVGDRHVLSQALVNLLDNAVKYGPEGSAIAVAAVDGPDGPELAVADRGPGIPKPFRDKVLQRFYRLDASRNAPGSGLGLSLVAAAAKLHGAALVLDDNAPGLRVTLRFPRGAVSSRMELASPAEPERLRERNA